MSIAANHGARPTPHIAAPETNVTAELLIRRAEEMIPLLREQQDASDARGHFSDEILKRFVDAGFYRILLPKMFGGYELSMGTFLEVVRVISRGHPSSGWCFCLSASHCALLASHWPEQAQRELFGPTGEFRAPHRAIPNGTITPAPGGYRITGTWSYASGIPVSTHFAGNVLMMREGAPPEMKTFFVPKSEVTVLDDWGGGAALGMQGSGSNSVKLENVFVPESHIVGGDHLFGGDIDWANGTHGTRLHGNPLYLGVFGGWYHLCFTAIMVGAAQAAIDEFDRLAHTMRSFGKPHKLFEDADSQRIMGEALMLTDAAEAVLRGGVARATSYFDRWQTSRAPITTPETMSVWAMAGEGARMGARAVEMLFNVATPVAAREGQKLQRYLRDVKMYLIHPSSQPWIAEARGQTYFGLPIAKFAPPPPPQR